jgi:uncharacterized membrane protein YsdA (DUF1294 family)
MLALTILFPAPVWLYLLMSLITFFLYLVDKRRAGRGAWRISENQLHCCELLCGWPGALVAQQVFRHKRRKTQYLVVFWAIVLLHALFWAWWMGWLRR